MRRRQKKKSYAAWDKYRFEDYRSRSRLAQTFNSRHAPLSLGVSGTFGTLLKDPEAWTIADTASVTTEKATEESTRHLDGMNNAAQQLMDEWDSDNEQWVPRV